VENAAGEEQDLPSKTNRKLQRTVISHDIEHAAAQTHRLARTECDPVNHFHGCFAGIPDSPPPFASKPSKYRHEGPSDAVAEYYQPIKAQLAGDPAKSAPDEPDASRKKQN